jgi:hypothetical protein
MVNVGIVFQKIRLRRHRKSIIGRLEGLAWCSEFDHFPPTGPKQPIPVFATRHDELDLSKRGPQGRRIDLITWSLMPALIVLDVYADLAEVLFP